MSNLTKQSRFYDTGSLKREKENFQGYAFNEVDLRQMPSPISFQRSDFRGASFSHAYFSGNNFSNADFIDSAMRNVEFSGCQFKYAELYNSYFENSTFLEINFSNASLVKLIFINCCFVRTKFTANTIRECKFDNCIFTDCLFSKNSVDNVEFTNTQLSQSDLSNMTAINLFFDNCEFDKIIIDADYLGSYFFKGKLMDNIGLKYRGKIFKLDFSHAELLSNLFKIYFEKERYYEAVNVVIQKNLLEGKRASIVPLIELVVTRLIADDNYLKRSYQFEYIFLLLEYYLNTGNIVIDDYFDLIALFETVDLTNFNFKEQIDFNEKVHRLKTLMDVIDFSIPFISTVDADKRIHLEIRIDESDELQFESCFSAAMNRAAERLPVSGSPYAILDKRKGSILYDIVCYEVLALLILRGLRMVMKEARKTMNESMNLIIDYGVDSSLRKLSGSIKQDHTTLKKIREIKEIQAISAEMAKADTAADRETKKLASFVKSLIIHPNHLTDRE